MYTETMPVGVNVVDKEMCYSYLYKKLGNSSPRAKQKDIVLTVHYIVFRSGFMSVFERTEPLLNKKPFRLEKYSFLSRPSPIHSLPLPSILPLPPYHPSFLPILSFPSLQEATWFPTMPCHAIAYTAIQLCSYVGGCLC